MRWDTPDDTEILRLEERQAPRGQGEDDVKELIETAVTSSEQDWRIFRHGAPTEEAKQRVVEVLKEVGEDPKVDLEEEGRIPAVCVDTGPELNPKRKPSGDDTIVFEDRPLEKLDDRNGAFEERDKCPMDFTMFNEDDYAAVMKLQIGTAEKLRRCCEERAQEVWRACTKENRSPTTEELETVLLTWKGRPNRDRNTANGGEVVESDAFGLMKPLNTGCGMVSRTAGVPIFDETYECVGKEYSWKRRCRVGCDYLEQELGRSQTSRSKQRWTIDDGIPWKTPRRRID